MTPACLRASTTVATEVATPVGDPLDQAKRGGDFSRHLGDLSSPEARPMPDPLRLATFAVPLSGNKGSASMLLGLRDAFENAGIDAHFDVFSYYPRRDADVAAAMPNVTVHPGHPKHLAFGLIPAMRAGRLAPARWRRHAEAVAACDVALCVGGTTFADSMGFKVPWNVLAALPGLGGGRPVAFLSQTLGPFERPANRRAARWTLGRAAAVHGRGRTSADNARAIGIENAVYRPDLSFTMRLPSFDDVAGRELVAAALAEEMATRGAPAVGVAPNSIVLDKAAKAGLDYVGFLAGAIDAVRAEGLMPVLIPHSYRAGGGGSHNNDRSLCKAVLDRLSPEARRDTFHLDADLSPQDLRAVIGRLHLLVASRFHSMVSALATGVPAITYGWGHQKYDEVLAEFGATDLYTPYESMDLNAFAERFRAVLASRDDWSRRINDALPTVRAQAAAVPAEIAALAGR